jgi:hypothetical protein
MSFLYIFMQADKESVSEIIIWTRGKNIIVYARGWNPPPRHHFPFEGSPVGSHGLYKRVASPHCPATVR